MMRAILSRQERADLVDTRRDEWAAKRAKEIAKAIEENREMIVDINLSWPAKQATAWQEFECWLGERVGMIHAVITGGALPAARVQFAEEHAQIECDKLPDSFFVAEICDD
jgi:hypothetical protein